MSPPPDHTPVLDSLPPPAVPLTQVGLTPDEYRRFVTLLGRAPNTVELGMAGAMWSEHCGYKNSRPLLRRFPTSGPRVLQGPGENAGAVDIGDGLAVVFKIESHNHPSAVEPVEGAATGVGGIVRDVFTMGARPVALLNSLRFGPLTEARNRYLFGGVVAGIGRYGNCIGVPTVGGEIYFDPSYSGNPLVNAMCVGLIRADDLMRARAEGVGNPVLLVGADTGRDGLGGATFASDTLGAENEAKRPAVQVGNPFLEKLLIEACLELLATGIVVAMQDLGAAGLTSSTVELAGHGGAGIRIDVAHVPRRERGMTPYEIMLSESQERMLVVVQRGTEAQAQAIFDKWGLHFSVIGEVTGTEQVEIFDGAERVVDVPARIFIDECPVYERQGTLTPALQARQNPDWAALLPPEAPQPDYSDTLLRLLAAPNIASKASVYRTYDHTIMSNTVIAPGEGDAAVIRIKGTRRGLALTTDCNSRWCDLDPYTGGAAAVAEAARNLVCVGAEPLAVTDCLNFGNPERPAIFYQMERCVAGMIDACTALGTPVVSGNVSLYNETEGQPILPTPVVGMVGLLEDVEQRVGLAWPDGATLLLLHPSAQTEQPTQDAGETPERSGTTPLAPAGRGAGGEGRISPTDGARDNQQGESTTPLAPAGRGAGGEGRISPTDGAGNAALLGASEYLATIHGAALGRPPAIDLDAERRVQAAALAAIRTGHVQAAHDCSEGGLAVAIAEGCIAGNVGATLALEPVDRWDVALFHEAPSRILLACRPADVAAVTALATAQQVAATVVGTTGGPHITCAPVLRVALADAALAWRTAI